jgi:hypothetical protein
MRVYGFDCGGDHADFAVNDPFDENVGKTQYRTTRTSRSPSAWWS